MYICNCGREFEKQKSLTVHARFCDEYIISTKKSIYKTENDNYLCECGKIFEKSQSLNAHFSHCLIHRKGEPENRDHVFNKKMCGWDNFTNEQIENIHIKAGETLSKNIENGKVIPSFQNRKHKEESKDKIRVSYVNSIIKKNGSMNPRYSKQACEYLDNLSKENNWNIQHALNGGEYHIDGLGYFVDGYDKILNIVVEYDEPLHYLKNGELRKKDKKRQNKIISELNCKFFRYNELKNILYEII